MGPSEPQDRKLGEAVTYTIVLSGPKAAEPQARTALASAGFPAAPTVHDHGLHAEDDQQAITFLTCAADDIDGPSSAIASLGYRLRQHYETPPDPEPSPLEQIAATMAEMQAQIAELKKTISSRSVPSTG